MDFVPLYLSFIILKTQIKWSSKHGCLDICVSSCVLKALRLALPLSMEPCTVFENGGRLGEFLFGTDRGT